MEDKNCPICEMEVFSEFGIGCRFCGMPLSENQLDFCCDISDENYEEIIELDNINKFKTFKLR